MGFSLTQDSLAETLHKLVCARYGSLDEPDRSFVSTALLHRPHAAVIRRLAAGFAVEGDTDLNHQVAFEYLLRRDGKIWRLELSMVGPYAVFLRIDSENWSVALDTKMSELGEPEQLVLTVLADEGLTVLDWRVLSKPIALRLYDAELAETRLYQALSSDVSVLPWKEKGT